MVRAFAIVYLAFLAATLWWAPYRGPGAGLPEPDAAATARAWVGPEPPTPSARAREAQRTGDLLFGLEACRRLVLLAIFLAAGGAAGLRDRVARPGASPWTTAFLAYLAFELAWAGLELPFDLLGFWRASSYGLDRGGPLAWAGRLVGRLAFLVPAGALAVLALRALIVARGAGWWLAAWGLAVPGVLLGLWAKPTWIDPLFETTVPMEDRALESRLLALAARAGVAVDRIHVVAKARQTAVANAYVVGFLGTRRIVVWDTLLARLEPDEVAAVVAHELGHYALGHAGQRYLAAMAGGLLLLAAAARLLAATLARAGPRLGLAGPADPGAWPLVRLVFMGLVLVAAPLELARSRAAETAADRFGLELNRDNAAAARAFVKLQLSNLSVPDPGPFHRIFRSGHPPLGERLRAALAYRPWAEGDRIAPAPATLGP